MGVDRRQEPNFVANAIGAHRVYVPEVRHPVEVKAGEEHLVRWLNRRVGAPFAAPSLVEHGWKLMGGRLVPDGGQPAAQFMYEDGSGRRLTLYIRKEAGTANTAFRFAEREGFGAFYWIDQPLAYALAGRLQREELMGLANLVYAQLEAVAASAARPTAPPAPAPAEPKR
jgi:anti-sigma factor RsiW